jgi:hypothetical protein
MTRLFVVLGATIGGAAGWWLGQSIGTMTAFFLGVIGTALGVYAGRRFAAGLDG